jgi:tryptophan synthase beta chain
MGLFHEFISDDVKMIGVEAGGDGIESGRHAARFATGSLGVLQGCRTYLLQDDDGNVLETHSVSAGLDYASVGPEHSYLRGEGRIEYSYVVDSEALAAFEMLSRTEGIIPALESAHALAEVVKLAPKLNNNQVIIVNLSGRGDKDVQQVARLKGIELS